MPKWMQPEPEPEPEPVVVVSNKEYSRGHLMRNGDAGLAWISS